MNKKQFRIQCAGPRSDNDGKVSDEGKTMAMMASCCGSRKDDKTIDGPSEKNVGNLSEDDVRNMVRMEYTKIAEGEASCGSGSCGCGTDTVQEVGLKIGYSEEEMNDVPDGANLGLGCGNPLAMGILKEGEVVVDLGSGAGFDSFLAAQRIGKDGSVIGVDMTPAMLRKAEKNAKKGGYDNVEFRMGVIENLPIANGSVDVVISNCVINLSPNKKRVFEEIFRVLRPGGRVMISDLVLLEELPKDIVKSISAYVGCVSGALIKDRYLSIMAEAGLEDVTIMKEDVYPTELYLEVQRRANMVKSSETSKEPIKSSKAPKPYIASIKVSAVKPLMR